MSAIGLAGVFGFLLCVAINRARWAIFPATGGPSVIHWLGGPPPGPMTLPTALGVPAPFDPLVDAEGRAIPGAAEKLIERGRKRARAAFVHALAREIFVRRSAAYGIERTGVEPGEGDASVVRFGSADPGECFALAEEYDAARERYTKGQHTPDCACEVCLQAPYGVAQ